jgi:hypothetical protein
MAKAIDNQHFMKTQLMIIYGQEDDHLWRDDEHL